MSKTAGLGLLAIFWMALAGAASAQRPQARLNTPHSYDLEAGYLRWPLPAAAKAYGKIDGDRLKQWVEEMTAIARKSRDDGEQFWGRIAGTSYDKLTEAWVAENFRKLGLENVHEQPFDLAPQWFPTSWEVSVSGGGEAIELGTAHPAKGSAPTPAGGLELDAVWVGLGTAADFLGRDVRGKAVFIHSVPMPSVIRHSAQESGAPRRADENGAAAVFVVLGIPGNFTTQLNSTGGASVPTFSMGLDDGTAVRERIEQGGAVKIRLRLEVEMREGLQCASVWGTLPGSGDEDIIVMAHHDSYFEGALDNASGTAAMLGLAEYFARIPREQRRRTVHFVSTAGHHAGSLGTRWMHDERETLLKKTALLLNCEHISVTQTYLWGPRMRRSNTTDARRWWVYGSDRLAGIVLDSYRLFGVAIYHEMEPTASGDMGAVCRDAPSVQVIESPAFYHSDHDSPRFIPASGLEAMTRAFARIIDEVNGVDLKDLVGTPRR